MTAAPGCPPGPHGEARESSPATAAEGGRDLLASGLAANLAHYQQEFRRPARHRQQTSTDFQLTYGVSGPASLRVQHGRGKRDVRLLIELEAPSGSGSSFSKLLQGQTFQEILHRHLSSAGAD